MNEDLKYLLEQFSISSNSAGTINLWSLMISLILCLACSSLIALVYRWTHRSVGYSQSYVQTLVVAALVTSVIMLVIGSNIARAFSLVGALSIIRFRNAIKETRDVGYIFLVMAVAMACGTRFYGVAIISTFFICAVIALLHITNFGANSYESAKLLKLQVPLDIDIKAIEPALQNNFNSFELLFLETTKGGLFREIHYSVKPKENVSAEDVIRRLTVIGDNVKVSYYLQFEQENV